MSRRTGRAPLTRQRVIGAAMDILDRDGAEALTMRALGAELGVDPMAAYHHVPNKEAILDGVVEAIWASLEIPGPSDAPWQSRLEAMARSIRSVLRQHPGALPVMATRPNLSTPGFRAVDHILEILHEAGLPAGDALVFVNAAGEFLLGHALAETSPPLPHGGADLVAAIGDSESEQALPHLRRALDEVDPTRVTMDAIFDAGIGTLIRGIEGRLEDAEPTRSTGAA